jgi:hypothetical protein
MRKTLKFLPLKRMSLSKNLLFRGISALFLAVVAAFSPAHAKPAFGFKFDGTLDKDAISKAYFDGEFGRVLPPLETYRQSFPKTATKDDSVFVFKYLSVIYAADPSTRKKAESYMVQLLKLTPTIELLDMYISDQISAIFNNVRNDYEKQQHYVRDHDIYGHPISDTTGTKHAAGKDAKSSSKAWIGWTAAGVGLVAVAGTTYLILSEDEKSPTRYSLKP